MLLLHLLLLQAIASYHVFGMMVDAQDIDCSSVPGPIRIKNSFDGAYYDVVKNELEYRCLVQKSIEYKRLSPDTLAIANSAYNFASLLTNWVRNVLGLEPNDPSSNVRFAFYPPQRSMVCNSHVSGPYIQTGGGAPLCDLVLREANKMDDLHHYLQSVINLGSSPPLTKDQILKQVKVIEAAIMDLGYDQVAEFPKSYNSSYCVYNPNKDKEGKRICTKIDNMPKDYSGMSGGGGSGAGFEIFCASKANWEKQKILLGGGGGGGGGMTSPNYNPVSLLRIGGGGGGGVQIGKGAPGVSGGYGNSNNGNVTLNPLSNPTKFASTLREVVIPAMKACEASPTTFLLVMGGGGGGGGWEGFLPPNPSNPVPSQVQRQGGFGFGYGFQFAFGTNSQVVLNSDADPGSIPIAICPFGGEGDNWKKCLQSSPSNSSTGHHYGGHKPKPINGTLVSIVTRCASLYASAICGLASYVDKKTKVEMPYGAYSNYESCNCPISNMYSQHYLPDTSQYKYLRTVKCSYTKTTSLVPPITIADIKKQANKVCPAVDDCMMFEPCKDSKAVDNRVYVSSEIVIPIKAIGTSEGDVDYRAQDLICNLFQNTLKQRLTGLADIDADGICESFSIDKSSNACQDFSVDQNSCWLLSVSEKYYSDKKDYEKVMNVSNRALSYRPFTAGLGVAMKNKLKFQAIGILVKSETTTMRGALLKSAVVPFSSLATCDSLSMNTRCDCVSSSNQYCKYNTNLKKCQDTTATDIPQPVDPTPCNPLPPLGRCSNIKAFTTCKGYYGCDWISNSCVDAAT